MRTFFSFLVIPCFIAACGSSATCPPGYPVLRDGSCYRADGSTPPPDSGSQPARDGGGPIDAALAYDASGADAGSVACIATHPIVDGDRRYCDVGACFCADPDACFPAEVAESCCEGGVVCGPPDEECVGTHPIVDGPNRSCEPGDCFCADPDACFPSAVAASCCSVEVVCE